MPIIGTVDSLWRYPVKSMRGEELEEMFAGYAGVYGDRLFAFGSTASPKGFPYFTGRLQRRMILYRPSFRFPDKAAQPPNLSEAQSMPPGATPLSATPAELMIEVETPDGNTFAIDDPALMENLRAGVDEKHELTLLRSDRPMTDCRPLSLFSMQTARKLADEIEAPVDKRCFRASIYLDLPEVEAFTEEEFIGRSLRIGAQLTVAIVERDPRCMMIILDPDTAEKSPALLKQIAQAHKGNAGVYGAVLAEGVIRRGDPVELLDRI